MNPGDAKLQASLSRRFVEQCNVCGARQLHALLQKDGYQLVRCGGCSLVLVADPPDEEGLKQLYSFQAGYHSALRDDNWAVAHHRREAEKNCRLLRRHVSGGRLLDVGCSTGLFLSLARAAGWQAQGLEYSADSAEIARHTGTQVHTGALVPGLYARDSFDVVTLWDVIEHLPDPRSVVAVLAEIVRPGGLLVLKTPNADGLYPRLSLAVADRIGYWGHPDPPGHLFQFSVATLCRLVQDAGFEPQTVHHGCIPLRYSFGSPVSWFRSAKWAAYCMTFAPIAWLGPLCGQGDDVTLFAVKASQHP